MSTWQKDLIDHVLADTAVAAITTQGWWTQAPDMTAMPYFVIREITGQRGLVHSGGDNTAAGRVQLDCFGSTPAEAIGLREAITTVLHGLAGKIGATFFGYIRHNTELDLQENTLNAQRATTDFELSRYLVAAT